MTSTRPNKPQGLPKLLQLFMLPLTVVVATGMVMRKRWPKPIGFEPFERVPIGGTITPEMEREFERACALLVPLGFVQQARLTDGRGSMFAGVFVHPRDRVRASVGLTRPQEGGAPLPQDVNVTFATRFKQADGRELIVSTGNAALVDCFPDRLGTRALRVGGEWDLRELYRLHRAFAAKYGEGVEQEPHPASEVPRRLLEAMLKDVERLKREGLARECADDASCYVYAWKGAVRGVMTLVWPMEALVRWVDGRRNLWVVRGLGKG